MSRALAFDPLQRRIEKEASRREDQSRLFEGRLGMDALKQENGLFSSLKIVSVSVSDGHINLKRER